MEKVTLYIATHKTGLKYFGKTRKFFTEEELQKYYHGSGSLWSKHLKEYGDDVTMEIYGIYNLSEVSSIAQKFSKDNNIVESKDWANRKIENGLDGWGFGVKQSDETKLKKSIALKGKNKGFKMSEEHKEALNNSWRGKHHTEEAKAKISIAAKSRVRSEESKLKVLGKNNPNFTRYYFYNEEVFYSTSSLAERLEMTQPFIFRLIKNLDAKITKSNFARNNFLKREYDLDVVGKTWRDLGFNFIEKEQYEHNLS